MKILVAVKRVVDAKIKVVLPASVCVYSSRCLVCSVLTGDMDLTMCRDVVVLVVHNSTLC